MSSVSRAELEAMSKDELIEHVTDLQGRVDDLEIEVERLDTISIRAIDRAKNAEEAVGELTDRLDDLEAENERLRDRVDECADDSPEQKLTRLVEHAHNRRNGDAVVTLSPGEIQGAWACSERWAYQLCDADDGLPAEYNWVLSAEDLVESQYGNVELDASKARKRIGIDFEGVHSAGVPLNRFINGTTEKGGGE